jgi:hypothetical protein
LRSKRKRASVLAAAALFATLAISTTPALAATQKYTCTLDDGQTRTITQGQYEKLVGEFGQAVVDDHCDPVMP